MEMQAITILAEQLGYELAWVPADHEWLLSNKHKYFEKRFEYLEKVHSFIRDEAKKNANS